MKICTKCKTKKQLSEFSKDSKRADGLQYSCKECFKAYRLENYERITAKKTEYARLNAEKIREMSRAHRLKNREKIYARKREKYMQDIEQITILRRFKDSQNKELLAARQKAYRASNPEKLAQYNRNRRAFKKSADGKHAAEDVRSIFTSQRGLCASCKTRLIVDGANKYHVDHIVPLSRGGSNDKYNIQCLCQTCNVRKNAKDPIEWANQNGKLL
jgi:5-methylcytosine-specific restriction endonuclease McrA